MTPAYFDKVRPTYLENWSAGLTDLSIEQIGLPLTLHEARALGSANQEFGNWFANQPSNNDFKERIARITERIEKALAEYSAGAFVRLGSRSAKDSIYARIRGLRISDAASAVKLLTSDSRRIAFDLRLALKHDYKPYIFVRRWLEIPVWAEFRCFMRDRKLIGISQYDCQNAQFHPQIHEHADQIKSAVESFFEQVYLRSHLDDAVFDVFVEISFPHRENFLKVTLLEINPFIPQTDACLFNWSKNDFDGSFRFL